MKILMNNYYNYIEIKNCSFKNCNFEKAIFHASVLLSDSPISAVKCG